MSRFVRHGKAVLALAVALTLTSLAARADLKIQLEQLGGPGPTIVDSVAGANPVAFFNGPFGDFTVTVLSSASNSPGSPPEAFLLSSNTSVVNNAAGPRTLYIDIGSTDFASPAGSTHMHSSAGTTTTTSGAGQSTWTFQSWANNDNGQFSHAGFTGGSQVLDISTGGSSDNDSIEVDFLTLTDPYSLVQRYEITLAAGGRINFSTQTQIHGGPFHPVVPEPATVLAALTGLPVLGGLWLRRRKETNLAA
jgi:hypothetical protein